MKRFSNVILLGSGVLALSLVANAQTGGTYYPQREDPYYGNDPKSRYSEDGYSRQRGYDPNASRYGNDRERYRSNDDSLIGRVLNDLARAAGNARVDGHERKHFHEAAEKLQAFENRWARGKFDRGQLDKAIQNLEHLVDADQVRGRDRDMLARDMEDLRQFRANGSRYTNGYGQFGDDRYNHNRRYDRYGR